MRFWIALATALCLAASPAAAQERHYSVVDFDRVVVEGPYEVTLLVGAASSAVAHGSREALERVSIDVAGRTLRVRPNRSAWGGYPGDAAEPVTVALATRDLRAGLVAGSGALVIRNADGMRLDLTLEGSGRLVAQDIAVDLLTISLVGSGRMEGTGRAGQLRAAVHGTADLAAADLVARDANLVAETAGRVVVGVSEAVQVTASGLGDVEIVGSPSCQVRGASAARVRCGR